MTQSWRSWDWGLGLAGFLVIGGAIACTCDRALAQITPDATLGTERSVVRPNVNVKGQTADQIEGGAARGANLFHSFSEFNVGDGQRVYFANPSGIDNILSRVTGTNASNILGTLGVNGGANLFLLNPQGIIFGPNAKLDIAGSFVASTANRLVFENGSMFSATNPQAPPLLTINVTPGLQYGSNQPGAITNAGNLSVGQNLTLAAGNLDLQGQLHAGRNLTLQALNTLKVRDSVTSPFIASAGGQLTVQGNQGIKLFALNHPDSGLFSGRDMVLRSANTVEGDAHYTTGGTFKIEKLDGSPGILFSPKDPVIRANGDVLLGGYQGASLHIFAGGSVTIPGGVVIVAPDPVNGIVEDVTLSNGTTVSINGRTKPTLDVRAGTTAIGTPGITDTFPPTGIIVPPLPSPIGNPTSANITIGGILNQGGVVFLTNQYKPNPSLPGGAINVTGLSGVPGVTGAITTGSLSGNGGSVIIDSRNSIALNGTVEASSFSPSLPLPPGNGGDITLLANGDINTADINSLGLLGGNIKLTSNGKISLANSLIISGSASPFPGLSGDINVNTRSLSLTNGARMITATLGAASGGNVNVKASDSVDLSGTQALSLIDTLTAKIPLISVFVANLPPEAKQALIAAPGSPLNSPASSLLAITAGGTGAAGNVSIETGRVSVRDGSEISAYSFGQGSGGNLTVKASDAVELIGTTPRNIPGGFYSQSYLTGDSGKIMIDTGRLIVRGGSLVSSATLGPGKGGDLTVNASESVELSGITPDGQYPSGVGSLVRSTGGGGNVTVNTKRLIAQDGAGMATATFSGGNAGNLTVNASESVELSGVSALTGIPGGLSADTTGAGSAGNLNINTRRLIVRDGSIVSASTYGTGTGNTLSVNASESVQLSGKSAGGISSGLYAQGFGAADAGNLEVRTGELIVQNGARVTVSTGTAQEDLRLTNGTYTFGAGLNLTFPDRATGNAGTMTIAADSIKLDNQGSLIAKTVSGMGGNIILQVPEGLIQMRRSSVISAEAFGDRVTSEGGNVNIDTQFLVGVSNENNDIIANAFGGPGGNIDIKAQSIFGLEFRNLLNPRDVPTSDITASSRFNTQGTVNINTPDVDPSRGLTTLPAVPVDVEGLVDRSCRADVEQKESQFVVTGRGGLPPNPNEPIRDDSVLTDWVTLNSQSQNPPRAAATAPPENSGTKKIVEAQGWEIDPNGNVILTAQSPTVTPHRPWQPPTSCKG
jgi:filamentous hemagglutinin family protein